LSRKYRVKKHGGPFEIEGSTYNSDGTYSVFVRVGNPAVTWDFVDFLDHCRDLDRISQPDARIQPRFFDAE
jgi:hypothetical protein